MALAQELIYHNRSVPYLYYLSVLHYFEEKYEDAIIHVTEAVKQHGKDYSLWSLMGHAHYKLGNKQQAMDCYQHVVDSFDRPNDIHFVELRLGNYYLEDQNYETARALLLDACKFTPSPATWFGVGVACYMVI
ncbi:Cilia- and flagella-associated protein 70 [Blattella germanica]|nr:Cilia- and flagella-associated protein 70 [Blattella germanica]